MTRAVRHQQRPSLPRWLLTLTPVADVSHLVAQLLLCLLLPSLPEAAAPALPHLCLMARRPVPVFVGNISFETSEAMVRDLFSSVGPVMAVRFVQDKETGKTKGYGFVEFGDPALAEAAVRVLNGRELGGRALRVDFAEHPDGTRVVVGQRRGESASP